MDASERRKARNEAVFRDANESIAEARRALPHVDAPTPFICECEEPHCTAIIRVDLAAYEEVRRHPARFLIAPGHKTSGDVIEERDDYNVVAKSGVAGEVAAELDPRH